MAGEVGEIKLIVARGGNAGHLDRSRFRAIVRDHDPGLDRGVFVGKLVKFGDTKFLIRPPAIIFDAEGLVYADTAANEHHAVLDVPIAYPLGLIMARNRVVVIASDETMIWEHAMV